MKINMTRFVVGFENPIFYDPLAMATGWSVSKHVVLRLQPW